MTKKRNKRKRKPKGILRWLTHSFPVYEIIVIGLILFITIHFVQLQRNRVINSKATTGVPTPVGFPTTAQDVGTLVGESSSSFTLPDESGQSVMVILGQAERPTVLFFNMGYG